MSETRELSVGQEGGCLHAAIEVKPHIPVTLVAVDTLKPHLAERAIEACLKQATFDDVKLLTNDMSRKHAVKIETLNGVEGYSNFMIRQLNDYVKTSHCLVVQWDGYVINAAMWRKEFRLYDYIGSPWQNFEMLGGNGGFSLRSKRLLNILATRDFGDAPHPEDNYICFRHGPELQALGMQFCSPQFSNWFSYEGRMWNGGDWVSHPQPWQGQFGFHSFLTKLPEEVERPTIFHHTGDMGDVIYSLPVVKLLGGGVFWISPDNHFPFPSPTRNAPDYAWGENICPLLDKQDYIWKAQFTPGYPHSTDVDLNEFRKSYTDLTSPNCWGSLFNLHLKAFGLQYPEDQPWLTVDSPVTIPDKPIIINRTKRYHNDEVQLWPMIEKHHKQMLFIGHRDEYDAFRQYCAPLPPVDYWETRNLLDVARLIAGAKVFVGNQSCPMAIAIGLCKPIVQEVWRGNANCIFKRQNAVYCRSGVAQIPEEWLT